jgi:hypothetical protein
MQRKALLLLAALSAGALLGAGPVSAQSRASATAFEDQVRTELTNAAVALSRDGYRLDESQPVFLDAMEVGKSRLLSLRLQAGVSYRIVGVCDDDCKDLDMELYDDAGKFIVDDTAGDAVPWTDVTPMRTANFTARVWLANCEAAPCYVGAMVLRK